MVPCSGPAPPAMSQEAQSSGGTAVKARGHEPARTQPCMGRRAGVPATCPPAPTSSWSQTLRKKQLPADGRRNRTQAMWGGSRSRASQSTTAMQRLPRSTAAM